MDKKYFNLIILLIPVIILAGISLAKTVNQANAQDVTAPVGSTGTGISQQTTLSLEQGPGGPILVISNPANSMSYYYAEVLRAEGLNEFAVLDITVVDPSILATYDIVILGEMSLSSDQVSMISDWVYSGGSLIAMRPDKQLASLLGITDASSTISDSYILVDTNSGPGVGIVSETMQFHGIADLYATVSATPIAEIYSGASTPTGYPAITMNTVGPSGGKAAAYTFDLARSLVYTRQGNPGWAYQHRNPWKTHYVALDLFYPDWIDFNKIDIPQADEQQRLFANMIVQMNMSKKPLPRFWYFPRGEKAVVIMTGDDHNGYQGKVYTGNTASYFGIMNSKSPVNCSVENWECVRATSYLYFENPMTDAEAASFENQGFELGLHVDAAHTLASWCASWTAETLVNDYQSQISSFYSKYLSLPVQVSERSHCYSWYGYTDQPVVQNSWGIRMDTNIPYWPEQWVLYRPGFMIGTVMPMRFVDMNDQMIDVYNAATIITDDNGEFGQPIPYTIDTLLDWAIGREGYYGAFTINMHSDNYYNFSYNSARKIIDSALARDVPVVSGRQMVEWLDGRNSSAFQMVSWNPPQLTFEIIPGAGANGLQGMIPLVSSVDRLTEIYRNGVPVPFTAKTIKGIEYAFFDAQSGSYSASYTGDFTPPAVVSTAPLENSADVAVKTSVTANFNEAISPSTVNATTFKLVDSNNNPVEANVYFDPVTNSAVFEPLVPLLNSTAYTATLVGGMNGITDMAGNPLPNDVSWSFTTIAIYTCPCSIWDNSTPSSSRYANPNPIEVGLKFQAEVDGSATGVRFYKDSLNVGTHVAHLWDMNGTLLAEATFTNETPSGWQSVSFADPVPISADTTYIVSYFTSRYYSRTRYYFLTSGYDNIPLHALAEGVDGSNGVFKQYGGFPDQSTMSTNYWVDIIFDTVTPSDTTPPEVLTTSPTNGATGIDLDSNVTATFSEALSPESVNTSTFMLTDPSGTQINAAVSYDEATLTATLNPLATLAYSTTYTANLVGGLNGITDLAGNPLAADYSWSFITVEPPPQDTTPPAVLSVIPIDGTSDVNPNTNITASFSEALLPSTVNATTFRLADPADNIIGATITYDQATFITVLNPNIPLAYGTTYTASLKGGASGITDLAGNPLPSDYSWSFSTPPPPDTNPPTVISVFPADGSSGIDLNINAAALFSEALQPATVNASTFRLSDPAGNLIAALITYDETTLTATLDPLESLAHATIYTATLLGGSNGITDLEGNPLATDYSWSFTTTPDTTPPTILSVSPLDGSVDVNITVNVTAIANEALLPSTINRNTVILISPAGSLVDAVVYLDEVNNTITLDPVSSLDYSTVYTATLLGGSNGITDLAGNPLPSDYSWSFTTQSQYTCPCSIWSPSEGTTRKYRNPNAIEVGLKFQAQVDGYIIGVRFFKNKLNTGIHVAHLWTSDGTQLAEATFTNETYSGWQSVLFESPVFINANTTYVVSYLTEHYYSYERYYFLTDGVDNPPLHALAEGVDGGNGVFKQFGGFPDQTFESTNYWVDVIFDTALPITNSTSMTYLSNIHRR